MHSTASNITPAQVTRTQFLEKLTSALKANHEWASDAEKLEPFLAAVRTTLAGRKTVIIAGQSFKDAWKACGLKGCPTYVGLHALIEV